MRYVIIGASGFIGSSIKKVLSQSDKNECIGLTSSSCDLLDSSATKKALPSMIDGAVVVYAAGIPRLKADSIQTMRDNITMVHNFAQSMREAGPRSVIFLSSVEVYGAPERLPITEETPVRPETLYGVGKIAAEYIMLHRHRVTGVPLAILRLPGVYGPGDKGRGCVGAMVNFARGEGDFKIFGKGEELRDFVLAEDVGQIVSGLSQIEFDQLTLNIATGTSRPVREIVDLVFDNFGKRPLETSPQTHLISHLRFDVSRLNEILPQLLMIPLEEGLKRYRNI